MNYTFTNKFVVRQPLLPIQRNISKKEAINLFQSSEIIREAIFLASPDLYRELEKHIINGVELNPKLQDSMHKYLNRMSYRSTPFGLFAACAIGRWSDETVVNNNYHISRKTRLDMLYLCNLCGYLIRKTQVQEAVVFYLNTSLYELGDTHRYVEYGFRDNNRTYELTEVPSSDELSAILKLAKGGNHISEFVNKLIEMGHDAEDSLLFVQDCIESQILIAEFEPNVTEEDNLASILRVLCRIEDPEINFIYQTLKAVDSLLLSLDNKSNKEEDYLEVIMKLKEIPDVPVNEKYVLQVDAFRNHLDVKIDRSVIPKIEDAMEILAALIPVENNERLNKFKKSFYDRYEDGFVPLAEVLDAEYGLGYPINAKGGYSDLIDDLEPPKNRISGGRKIQFDNRTKLLFELIEQSRKKNLTEISLSKDLLAKKRMTASVDRMPLSVSAIANLLIDGKINISYFSGPSAINVLSRFGHGSKSIAEIIGEVVEVEEKLCEDFILAEILHLPEGRIGNILLHPEYRKYKIPFLTGIGLENGSISITDLLIGVQNNMIVLWSKKLKKKIIPRLSNAHNYPLEALPLYYFLCDLQTQFTRRSLFFEWPDFGFIPDFYPRLVVGDVIISAATWNIEIKLLKDIVNGQTGFIKFDEMNIPSQLVFNEGDNSLVVDPRDINSIKMLLALVKEKEYVLLKEYLEPLPIFKNDDGIMSHELVIPMISKKPNLDISELKNITVLPNEQDIQKSFLPGSEWLYFKLYGGKQGVERILRFELFEFISQLKEFNLIDQWFFIRYADPNNHLRLRLKLKDSKQIGQVLMLGYSFFNNWIEQKLIYKLSIDTYFREIERYLYGAINAVEELFYHDSDSALSYLALIDQSSDRLRWLFALKSIDSLLNDFNFDLDEKMAFLKGPAEYFKMEFKADKKLLQKINQKFKTYKEEIHDYMIFEDTSSNILQTRSKNVSSAISIILKKYKSENPGKELNTLIFDFTHMLINRLFHFNPRFHELVIYEILGNYYKYLKYSNRNEIDTNIVAYELE